MGTRPTRRSAPPEARPAPNRCRGPSRGSAAAHRSAQSPSDALQLASDDDSLYLVGALVDLAGFGVANASRHRIFLEVAVTAEHLQGVERDLHRDIGGKELGHRCLAGEG